MAEAQDKCVQPAAGPIAAPAADDAAASQTMQEGARMSTMVGRPAPDFEASAFVDGGFKNVKLSDYSGQWVVLCFYPGDFTFV